MEHVQDNLDRSTADASVSSTRQTSRTPENTLTNNSIGSPIELPTDQLNTDLTASRTGTPSILRGAGSASSSGAIL